MPRTSCKLGLVLAIVYAGCTLEHPIADFAPDAAADAGPTGDITSSDDRGEPSDAPATIDVPSEDLTEPDVLAEDADDSATDASVDAIDVPPGDSAIDVPLPMESGVDVPPPPMDNGVDVPLPPIDSGVDVPAVDAGPPDTGSHADTGVDGAAPPVSCNGVLNPCSASGYSCDAIGNGHCVPCGNSGEICCNGYNCNGSLNCNFFTYVCH